jgi:hypothetical protein
MAYGVPEVRQWSSLVHLYFDISITYNVKKDVGQEYEKAQA